MNRFAKIAFAGVFAVLASASAEAQQQGQGQQPGQKGASAQGSAGQTGAYHGGIGQTPWFSNQDVRQQFKLSDPQYNQLNKSYGEYYTQYQQGINNLGKNLSAEQRTQKTNELQQRFNKNLATATDQMFTNPQQRQRYNQLNLQYQGYNAFTDPAVQEKLNLTAEQRQTLAQNGQECNKQMNGLGRTYQTDPAGTTTKYNAMRKQYGDQINTILTPEQQKSWQQMTGASYNFQPGSYFQTSATPGAPINRNQE
jgi:flagellar basal body-associated protein FliL